MSDFQTVNKKGNPVPTSVKKYAEQQLKLVEMGFDPETVSKALELSQGDIAGATVILLDDDVTNNTPAKTEEKHESTTHRNNSQSAGRTSNGSKDNIKENHHKMIATYKIQKCKEPPSHDRKMCIFWHSPSDRRRNPFEYNYSCYECPNTAAGNECKDGDACPHAHTMLERMFHPELYKISMCQRIQTSQKCDRGLLCAFAHSEGDLRASPSTAKLTDPVDGKPIKRQVPNTPAFNAILEKLARIIREAGPEGVIAADLPKKYIVQYTESLDLVDDKGEKYRVRDLLAVHPAVEVILQKGAQPKYVYDLSKAPAGEIPVNEVSTSKPAATETPVVVTPAPTPVVTETKPAATSTTTTTSNNNSNTKVDATTTSIKQRLVQVIKAAGKDGILGSDLPKKYLETFGEKLDVTDDSGAKIRLKDMIQPHTGVTVQMLKLQPKYVFDPTLVTTESTTATTSSSNTASTPAATPAATTAPAATASTTSAATTTAATTTNASKPFSYSSIASGSVIAGKSYSSVAATIRAAAAAAPAVVISTPAPAAAAPTISEPASKPAAPVASVAPASVPTPAAAPATVATANTTAADLHTALEDDEDAPSSEDPVFTESQSDPVDQLIGDDNDSDDTGLIGGEEIVAEITSYSDSAFEYPVTKDTSATARLLDGFTRKSDAPLMMAAPGLTKIARPTSTESAQSLSNLIASSMHLGNTSIAAPGASTIADFSERLNVAQNQCTQLQLQITKLQSDLNVKNNEFEGQSVQLRNMMQRLAEAENKSSNDEHIKHQLKNKEDELLQRGRDLNTREEDNRKMREERILELNQFYIIMTQVEEAINGMKCKEETFSEKVHHEDVQELLQFRKALKQYVLTIKGQLKQKFDILQQAAATPTSTATNNNNNNNNTSTNTTTSKANNGESNVPVTATTSAAAAAAVAASAAASRYVNTASTGAYEQAYYGSNAYGTTATHATCGYPGCRAEGIYTCAGCQKVSYCGAEHQRLHWVQHSLHCSP